MLIAHFVVILLYLVMSIFANPVIKVGRTEGLFLNQLRRIIPALTSQVHKGQMGRVGIVGGSVDFTGAPYYAGSASLKFGGDLSYIFCAKQAAIPIKSYSPELMVTPFYDDDDLLSESEEEIAKRITDFIPRLHSLVMGPGLGRKEKVLSVVKTICERARDASLPLVLDADALYMLSQSADNLNIVKGYAKCILTPNKMEFERLLHTSKLSVPEEASAADKLAALAEYMQGPTIVLKGVSDLVGSSGSDGVVVYEVMETGSMRRSGGQGDVLAGCLGTALHWAFLASNDNNSDSDSSNKCVQAAFLASIVTKMASEAAFREHHRSMTTPDLLAEIGTAMRVIEEDTC